MIDREQAIEAAYAAAHKFDSERDQTTRIVDAILALPDPVHEALEVRAERAEADLINLKAEYAFDCEVPIRELREELARLHPVHEAAREVVRQFELGPAYASVKQQAAAVELRAALADERSGIECPRCGWVRRPPPTDPLFPGRVPVTITDEMVERAWRSFKRGFNGDPPPRLDDVIAALDAALNGGT